MRGRVWATLASILLATGVLSVGSTVAASPSAPSAPRSGPTMQLGLNTWVQYSCQSLATWKKIASTVVTGYKSLGANSIAIAVPFYTSSGSSNNFYAAYTCGPPSGLHTPPPWAVAVIADAAHAAGLQVLLRPLLNETNLWKAIPGEWRGVIKPTKPARWFYNYLGALKPYLIMAQSHRIEHFSISSELGSMSHFKYWKSLIGQARALYRGDLVFDFSWVPNGDEVRPRYTSPAMDAYPIFTGLSPYAQEPEVLRHWNNRLKTDTLPFISFVTIDEVGIGAQDGAYSYPNAHYLPSNAFPFDQRVQANWFAAACGFAKQHHMKGIYFWANYFTFDGGALLTKPDPKDTGFLQPQTQLAIKACFKV